MAWPVASSSYSSSIPAGATVADVRTQTSHPQMGDTLRERSHRCLRHLSCHHESPGLVLCVCDISRCRLSDKESTRRRSSSAAVLKADYDSGNRAGNGD